MATVAAGEQPTADERRRVQFEFSATAYADMVRMREQYGAQSLAELVRDALRLYDWYRKQRAEGFDVALVRNGKVERVVELMF